MKWLVGVVLLVGCGVKTNIKITDNEVVMDTDTWSESTHVYARCYGPPRILYIPVPVVYEKQPKLAEKPL